MITKVVETTTMDTIKIIKAEKALIETAVITIDLGTVTMVSLRFCSIGIYGPQFGLFTDRPANRGRYGNFAELNGNIFLLYSQYHRSCP